MERMIIATALNRNLLVRVSEETRDEGVFGLKLSCVKKKLTRMGYNTYPDTDYNRGIFEAAPTSDVRVVDAVELELL